jgi:SAM-dependent methyltransferase
MTFTDHFAAVAAAYAANRPTYPPQLFAWLAAQCPGRQLAWDCATGTGQAAVALADHFEQVWATDASSAQLEAAVPGRTITYHAAPAEASGLPDCCADLITVAQALHWFDLEPFYSEVRRVLKPGGLLAVWTYGVFHAEGADNAAVQQMLDRFYYETVGPCWPPERRHVEDGYAHLAFPFEPLAPPAFRMAVDWSLPELIGYLRSWSAVSRYQQQTGTDPTLPLAGELAPLWGQLPRRVTWPLSLKVGRIPS